VADVGAGPGYFALRLARAVGAGGQVRAADVEPEMVAALRERMARDGVRNVTPLLARDGVAPLEPGSCHLVLSVNVFHHVEGGPAFLAGLAAALRPGGRLAIVDFHRRETPVGPPVGERVSREAFLEAVRAAGLAVLEEHSFLPYQYFFTLAPR